MIELLNIDCMDYMKDVPDKYFDLAIVDPPYGINGHAEIGVKKGQRVSKWMLKEWDGEQVNGDYFKELFRVSKEQVVWGWNYFADHLNRTRCFLVWDKVQRIDMADCEIAWTSFETSARIFTFARSNIQGFRNPQRFHPCEKPIKLYSWILKNYAKEGDRIFDSHFGSGSIAIACYDMQFDFVGCEIDKDYYKAAVKRYGNHIKQLKIF